jgi:flagellar motor switch protein FliM
MDYWKKIIDYGIKHKTEVLSQDEIDKLLTAINAGDTEPEDFKPSEKKETIFEEKIKTFNKSLTGEYDLE